MYQLVLIRHGESAWNLENRFTGWVDVALTETGVEQAKQAGVLLKKHGFAFDVAYTSLLDRAIATLWHSLVAMDSTWIPVHKHWRLNERHYGGLQGLNKADMARQFGEEQVLKWRRSYDIPPPASSEQEHSAQCQDPRYSGLAPNQLPYCESLKDTVQRVLPFWDCVIAPSILSGKRVLISAHGNSIRALVKYLDQVDNKDIVGVNIPNGKPLVYTLDQNLNPIEHHYLEA